MPAPPFIDRFSLIARNYDALLCDAWGVVHNGVRLFDGAEKALRAFRAERGPVVILTNAPRPSSIIPRQLDRLGLSRDAYDAVITSGDAIRAEIMSRLPAPAYHLGPEKDDPLFDGVDIVFTPLEDAAFMVCTGLDEEYRETPDDYRSLLEAAAARKLPMICANPDIVVRLGDRLIFCAGALAELYERLGGEVVHGGKPHPPIYNLAFARLADIRGAPLERSRALAVGDGVATDIAGANREGVDAVFIAGPGGVHDVADAEIVAGDLAKVGAAVIAVMESLRW